MQQTAVTHNPFTFYLRTLLYMFVALFLRLVALAPLACLFLFPQGSPLKLLSLLCPAMLALLILPLRYSFAEALVRQDKGRRFSFDTALGMGNYGEKLSESLLGALHVAKWGLPLLAMLLYAYYWYKEVDALTLLKTLTELGRGWSGMWCAVANFFLGLVGGTPLAAPQNTLMEGVTAVLAALGLGVLVLLYGAVRNSAARYVWVVANRCDRSPRKELRRSLRGRRLGQLGVALVNLALWVPFLAVVVSVFKGVVTQVADGLMTALSQRTLPVVDLAAAVSPLLGAFVLLYMPLLPVRRILTAAYATHDRRAAARPAPAEPGAGEAEAAPAYMPGSENGPRP